MNADKFRTWAATATLAQAQDARDSFRISRDQWHAYYNAWLLSAPRFAPCFTGPRAVLSDMIRAQESAR